MNKIVTALNFLDDELIVSAFESMETESKTANSSTQRKANTFKLHPKRWIAVFASLLLVVCLTPVVFILSKNGSEVDIDRAPSIYELYSNTGYYSFAKLKVSSIYEDEYYYDGYTESGGLIRYYLVMECVIEEDFYGVQESGTTIYMPIILSSTSITYYYDDVSKPTDRYEESTSEAYYEKSELAEWFNEYDFILAYFRTQESQQLKRKDDPDKEKITFYNITNHCMPKFDSIIPVKDNKVDLENRYYEKDSGYTYEIYTDYTDYITDGMSLDVVSENIRRLATKNAN